MEDHPTPRRRRRRRAALAWAAARTTTLAVAGGAGQAVAAAGPATAERGGWDHHLRSTPAATVLGGFPIGLPARATVRSARRSASTRSRSARPRTPTSPGGAPRRPRRDAEGDPPRPAAVLGVAARPAALRAAHHDRAGRRRGRRAGRHAADRRAGPRHPRAVRGQRDGRDERRLRRGFPGLAPGGPRARHPAGPRRRAGWADPRRDPAPRPHRHLARPGGGVLRSRHPDPAAAVHGRDGRRARRQDVRRLDRGRAAARERRAGAPARPGPSAATSTSTI